MEADPVYDLDAALFRRAHIGGVCTCGHTDSRHLGSMGTTVGCDISTCTCSSYTSVESEPIDWDDLWFLDQRDVLIGIAEQLSPIIRSYFRSHPYPELREVAEKLIADIVIDRLREDNESDKDVAASLAKELLEESDESEIEAKKGAMEIAESYVAHHEEVIATIEEAIARYGSFTYAIQRRAIWKTREFRKWDRRDIR